MTTLQRDDTRLDEMAAQLELLVAEAEERRRLREAFADLTGDLSPIANQGMESVTRVLAEAEERGYADFTRGGLAVVDKVVTSFTRDDLEALGDNVVLILETVKEMTQPEVMQMMRSTLHNVQETEEPADPPSLLSLLRELRKPESRRGLHRLVVFLESLGSAEPEESTDRKEAQQ